jgi:hypothetical protein
MSKKSVIILWIIALVLGISVTTLKLRAPVSGKANTERSRGQTLLESFPADQVASIQLKGYEKSVTLTKKESGWVVAERGDYPANVSSINNLLRTIEKVKVNNAIEAGPTYGKRFGIDLTATSDEKHGTQIIFTNASNENIATLFLGKDSDGGGRFIQNATDTSGIYVTSESFPTATASAKDWLDTTFFNIEKIKSISISTAGKADAIDWKLSRADENAEFTLEGAKPNETLDTAITAPLKTILAGANFQDVASGTDVATIEKAADRRVATIETIDGFTYTITLVAKPAVKVPDALANPDEAPPVAEEESYHLSVKIAANFPKERVKAADEKPEDAKSKDEEFQATQKTLQEKLQKEQALQTRVYEVAKYTVDALLKGRAELLSKPADAAAANTQPSFPGQQTIQTSQPVQAVTPPVSIGE